MSNDERDEINTIEKRNKILEERLHNIFDAYLYPIFVERKTESIYRKIFRKSNIEIFAKGFTSDIVSRSNYEIFETLGDAIIANAFMMMCYAMGFTTSKELTNLLNNLCANIKQAELSRSLGLHELVNKSQLFMDDDSLAEDLLEALIGTLQEVLTKILHDRYATTPYVHGFVEAIYNSREWDFKEESKKNVQQLLKEYVETKHDRQIPFYRTIPANYVDVDGSVTVTVMFNNKRSVEDWNIVVLGTATVRVKNRDAFADAVKSAKYLAANKAIESLNITEEDIEAMRKERENSDRLQPLIRQLETMFRSAGFVDLELQYDANKLTVFIFLRDMHELPSDENDLDANVFSICRVQKQSNENTTAAYENMLKLLITRYQGVSCDEVRTSILSVRHNLNMRLIDIPEMKRKTMITLEKKTIDEVPDDQARILTNRATMNNDIVDITNSIMMPSIVSESYRGSTGRGRGRGRGRDFVSRDNETQPYRTSSSHRGSPRGSDFVPRGRGNGRDNNRRGNHRGNFATRSRG